MADGTPIEWTDATWTPIRARNKATGKVGWHCEHVSPGCVKCYSESFNEMRLGTGLPFKPGHRDDADHFVDERMLTQPLRWRRPRMVFVCSMTDLFGEWVPDEWIDRVFAVMALATQHTLQVLTKRPERMRAYLTDPRTPGRIARVLIDECLIDRAWPCPRDGSWPVQSIGDIDDPDDVTIAMPLPNVWLGVSAEDQRRADERVPLLLQTPAAVRWVSAEPLLGPIRFDRISLGTSDATFYADPSITKAEFTIDALAGVKSFAWPGLDWLVAGGESGHGARPMHPDWVRSIRDQCAAAGVPFLFKQWGAWGTAAFSMSTGKPADRQFTDFQHWVNKADTWVRGGTCIDMDGNVLQRGADFMRARDVGAFPVAIRHRMPKFKAGRFLDGMLHDGFPIAAEVPFG